MSEPPASTPAGAPGPAGISEAAGEALLAAGFLFALDALANLKLTVGGFGLVAAGWMVALLAARLVRRAASAPGWLPAAVELLLPALWVGLCSGQLKQPWSAPQVVYAAGFVAVLWHVWRWLLARAEAAGAGRVGEMLRLLLVGAVAGGVVAPYFTDLQLGGTDARWYTSVFIDFLTQLRAGIFPVFLGQGDLSYNGSANLFRSAPLCLWLGGIWDVLTWQSLAPVAIRNLAVITAALVAGFGMYAVLVRLLQPPAAWTRWLAALGAVLYVLCPAVVMSLYYYELQMSFTALLALPWIVHGNVRTLQGDTGNGYAVLAVGLALAWLAHAPLAIIAICCTVALQFGRFIFDPAALAAQWQAAVGGGVLFALLSAYYFLGMSELQGVAGSSLPREAVFLLAVTLVILSAVRAVFFDRWIWLAGWLAGAALIAWLAPVWLAWVVVWSVLWVVAVVGLRRIGAGLDAGRAVLLAAITMLVAAALAQAWAAGRPFVPDNVMITDMAGVAAVRGDLLRPLSAGITKYGDTQPGYALWALAALGLLGAWWSHRLVPALLAAVSGLIMALILAVPGASEFVVGFAPAGLGTLVNLPMLYRLVPPLAALVVVLGLMTLLHLGADRRWVRRGGVALLVAGVLWSGEEAWRVVRIGFSHRATRAATVQAFSPDTYALGRYPYLMLFSPLHFMDGKQIPLLDSRLLTPHCDLIVGPDQLAQQAEKASGETFPLTSTVDKDYPIWRRFTPGWEVQPGETLLLRFEFAPEYNSRGWLIMSSNRIYQEYYLDPAYMGAGFGPGPRAARTFAVTNSGVQIERFTMRMKTDTGNTLPLDGGTWGRLHVSRYDPDHAAVRVDSLLPYRARVEMPEDGYLETPRQWIAGYRAWVDGQRTDPVRIPSGMLAVPLKAGAHAVVVQFAGSARLWTGLLISAATVIMLLVRAIGRHAEFRAACRKGFLSWKEANRN